MDFLMKLNCTPDLTMVEITKLLLNNSFMSDIQFEIDGKVINAHSFELMKRSIVFQTELFENVGEKKLVPVNDVSYDIFYQFIRFIYTDECDVTEEVGIDLLKLAIKYKVTRLENKLIDYFWDESRCLKLYEFCIIENYNIPKSRVLGKLLSELHKYLTHESFDTIHPDAVEEILQSDLVGDNTREIEIFNAVLHWINKYCESNNTVVKGNSTIERLVKLIRFPLMTVEEFVTCIPHLETILTDKDCGIILKKIALGQQYKNAKWNSMPRVNRFVPLDVKQFDVETKYDSTTIFSVANELLLSGMSFCLSQNIVGHVEMLAENLETQEIEVMKFRLYKSENFIYINVNSLGESILLKPNYQYTIHLTCLCSRIGFRGKNVKLDVIDPSNSVKLTKAGENIVELVFKVPS